MGDESTNESVLSLRVGSWFLLMLTISAICVFCSFAVDQRRSTTKMADGFDTVLPRLTEFALLVPNSVIFAGGAFLSIMLLVKECWLRNKVTAIVINIVVLASCVVLFEVHREAMSLPLRMLLNDLS